MPTLYGPTDGGVAKARIEIDYSVSYDNDHITGNIAGTVYLASQFFISDANNNWALSGDMGNQSGADKNISHGSGGGRTAIASFSGWRRTNATVSASVTGLSGTDGNVSASFNIPIGALAPYLTSYRARDVASTTFTADILGAVPNGGTLNNVQIQGNTVASPNGAWSGIRGIYADYPVHGLLPGTKYYFRLRVSNTTYGWGPWGDWVTFTTLPGVFVRHGGVWRNAIPYVKIGGVWKQAHRYVKHNGAWK